MGAQEKASLTGVWFYLRPFALRVVNFGSWAALLSLWVNFLWAPWPLSWNPIFDFLFTRSGGPLLYANHISSEIAVLVVATWYMVRNPGKPFTWLLVILTAAAVHELFIGAANFVIYQVVFDPKYYGEIALLLVVGFVVATKGQRIRLGQGALVNAAYIAVWCAVLLGFNLTVPTISGFIPGPAFYDPLPNALEVFSWIIPLLVWVKKPE